MPHRAGPHALDGVRSVHRLVNTGHRDVVDADLSGYYNTIPYEDSMKSVARRIVDRHVLRLMWLMALVEEVDARVACNEPPPTVTTSGAHHAVTLESLHAEIYSVAETVRP